MSIKISQLQPATSVTGSDLIVTVVTGAGTSLITEKATVQQVFNYITSSITDLTLNNLTVLDNTTLGSSSIDSLVVNATSQFNADLTASALNVVGNTALSTVSGTVAQFTELTASAIIASQLSSSNGQFNSLSGSLVTGSDARFTTVTASFSGDGLNLTNIPNGALQNSSITIGSTNISLGATQTVIDGITELTASSAYFSGDVFINGTASIVHLNTLNEQSLVVGDKYITILSGAADHTSLDGSGILWGSGSTDPTTDDRGAAAHVRYAGSFDKIRIFPGLYVSGALTASNLISGTQAYFNNIESVLVSGTQAQFSYITGTLIGSVSGATAQFTSITGTLSGSITGNAETVTNGVYTVGNQSIGGHKTFNDTITASLGITGTVAQFTSVSGAFSGSGTNIEGITTNHIVNFTNNVRSQFSAGANITIVGGVISSTAVTGSGTGSVSAGGVDQSIQFNVSSTFGGSPSLIYDYTNNILSGTVAQFTTITSSNLVITGNILIYETAALGDNAYILYNQAYDKLVVFPGLYITGALSASSEISGTTAFFTSIVSSELTSSDGKFNTLSGSHVVSTLLTGSDAKFTSVTASFSGNGSGLTNIPNGALQNSSITIGSTNIALGATQTVIDGITQLTASAAYFSGDVFINGTASIVHLNTLNEQSLIVGDKYITILSGAADHTSLDGSGILWGSGSTGPTVNEFGSNAHVRYRNSYDKLEVFPGLYISGALTASQGISGTLNNLTTTTAVVTGNLTLDVNHHVILGSASVADVTVTLPLVSDSRFRHYTVKKIDSSIYKIVISGSSGQTIDGIDGVEINTQYEALMFVNDGAASWYLI